MPIVARVHDVTHQPRRTTTNANGSRVMTRAAADSEVTSARRHNAPAVAASVVLMASASVPHSSAAVKTSYCSTPTYPRKPGDVATNSAAAHPAAGPNARRPNHADSSRTTISAAKFNSLPATNEGPASAYTTASATIHPGGCRIGNSLLDQVVASRRA